MEQSSFETVSEDITLSIRTAKGLSDYQLQQLLSVLRQELECWMALEAIPKPKIYTLIILRDNIIGALNQYRKDSETMLNLSKAESAVDSFMETALLN